MSKPRMRVPKTAYAGEVVTIKTLLSHRMESGHREDTERKIVPRKIINTFTCEFNGVTVFACDLGTGVDANPCFEFDVNITEAGTFKFTWIDDDGTVTKATRDIALS